MDSLLLKKLLTDTIKSIKTNRTSINAIEKDLKGLFEFYDAFMGGAAINDELQQVLFDWATINGYACVKVKSIAKRNALETFVKQKMYPGEKDQKIFL